MINDFIPWLKGMLDSEQSPSFGRTGAAFVIYFLVLWGCYIVSKTGAIPDIPYGWQIIIGVLWGVTGVKEAYLKGKAINKEDADAKPE